MNKNNFLFIIILLTNFCSSNQKISNPADSKFYALWDHSISVPGEVTTPSPSPINSEKPAKKKK